MRAGNFNMEDYINNLNENAETTGGNLPAGSKEGILIPDENKKSYEWLKKEFQKGKTEVKVEMKIGDKKFEPGYDTQMDLKSVKDFKPGMFGEVKTSDTEKTKSKSKTKTESSPINNNDEKKDEAENKQEESAEKKQSLNVDLKTKKKDDKE